MSAAREAAFLGLRLLRGRAGTARYLRGAALGIAVSLVPLLVVMEASTGMIEGITARLLEVGTYHLQVPLAASTAAPALDEAADAVARVAGVVAAVPERTCTAMLVGPAGAAGVTVRAVPVDVFSRDPGFASYVEVTGGEASLARPADLLVSAALARTLGVGAGDPVSVLTTWGEDWSGLPRTTTARVAGVFRTGYQELDATLAYASLAFAARSFSPRASRAFIGVKVADPFAALGPLQRAVAAAAGPGARALSWRDIEYARLASFSTTRALLLFIMALVVIVAAVNVSSGVLMVIIERREDLAILAGVGISPRILARAFLLVGGVTGLAGTVLGTVLGLLVAVNINAVIAGLQAGVDAVIAAASFLRRAFVPSADALGPLTLFNSAYYLSRIPVKLAAGDVAAAATGTLVLSALVSWLPAARAARARPLDTLRKV